MNHIRFLAINLFFTCICQNLFSMDTDPTEIAIRMAALEAIKKYQAQTSPATGNTTSSSTSQTGSSGGAVVQALVDSTERTKAEIKRQEAFETYGPLWERLERMKEAERQQESERSSLPGNRTASVPKVEGKGRSKTTTDSKKEANIEVLKPSLEPLEKIKQAERQKESERSTLSSNSTTSVLKTEGKGQFSEVFEQIRSEGLEKAISRSKEDSADFRPLWERLERMKEAERQQKTEIRTKEAHRVPPTSIDHAQPSLLRQPGSRFILGSQSFNTVPRQSHEQWRANFSTFHHVSPLLRRRLSFDSYSSQFPMTRLGSRPILTSSASTSGLRFGGVLSALSEKVLESVQTNLAASMCSFLTAPGDSYPVVGVNKGSEEQSSTFQHNFGNRRYQGRGNPAELNQVARDHSDIFTTDLQERLGDSNTFPDPQILTRDESVAENFTTSRYFQSTPDQRSVVSRSLDESKSVSRTSDVELGSQDSIVDQCEHLDRSVFDTRLDLIKTLETYTPQELESLPKSYQDYALSPESKQILQELNIDSKIFEVCDGNEVQQKVHYEFVSIDKSL